MKSARAIPPPPHFLRLGAATIPDLPRVRCVPPPIPAAARRNPVPSGPLRADPFVAPDPPRCQMRSDDSDTLVLHEDPFDTAFLGENTVIRSPRARLESCLTPIVAHMAEHREARAIAAISAFATAWALLVPIALVLSLALAERERAIEPRTLSVPPTVITLPSEPAAPHVRMRHDESALATPAHATRRTRR